MSLGLGWISASPEAVCLYLLHVCFGDTNNTNIKCAVVGTY